MNELYKKRLTKNLKNLEDTYYKVYKDLGGNDNSFKDLLKVMEKRFNQRDENLRRLDKRDANWYLSKDMIGYMVYTDLFSNDLKNLKSKIPYLTELGITYVHLMPLLKPRSGESDGGYAVENYLEINPKLGSNDEFSELLDEFRKANIDICIDYVINHTANTHKLALKALKGDVKYQDMYIMFDDRVIPDLYDKNALEVLPDKVPGNFTYNKKMNKWVFTSFSDFQWDLNFKNPYVFEQMTDIFLQLANKGITMLRLDAIPFMWKEVGTTCRNLDPINDLMHMLKLIKEIVCPAVAILGEAIVEPDEIFKYFGSNEKPECDILYNANYMVNILNAFATKDVRLLNIDNQKYQPPKHGTWMNYVRCHDDIGWGFNEDAIRSFGMDPYLHKQFLISFYNGSFMDSFAKGKDYQFNKKTKDARTNGTLASLLGLQKAIEENYVYEQNIAIKRILLAHAMILAHLGIPLIYSGDEIATLNSLEYLNDEDKKNDGRWIHRPKFDRKRANLRNKINTFEEKIFSGLKKMIEIRKSNVLFNGNERLEVVINSDYSVYSMYKQNVKETIVFIFNFSQEVKQNINNTLFKKRSIRNMTDLLTKRVIDFSSDTIKLAPYEVFWVKS